MQLVHEVAITGGTGSRNHGNALRYIALPLKLAVKVQDPLFFQAFQYLAPAPQEVSQGVLRVYGIHHKREAVDGVHRGGDA